MAKKVAKPKQKVNVAFRFDSKNVRAARLAKAAGSKLITEITNEAREAIRTAISKGIRDGVAPDDIARSLVGILEDTEAVTNIATTAYPGLVGLNTPQIVSALNYRDGLVKMGHGPEQVDKLLGRYASRKLHERAETIARTECMWALNAGAHAGYEQAMKQGYLPPDARLEWIVTPDERLCHNVCAPMSGKTKPIDPFNVTTFSNGMIGPPAHPRCLPGDSLISSVGRIAATSERAYKGDLIVIRTASGHELSCTANHPVLTDSGWIPARLLDVGRNVISLSRRDWMSVSNFQHENVPTRIKKVARSFDQLQTPWRRAVVPISAEHFHGDGEGSEIAVVRTNGLLGDGVDSSFGEQMMEVVLSDSDASSSEQTEGLTSSGAGTEHVDVVGLSATRSVSGGNLFGSSVGVHALPLDGLALTLVSRLNAVPKQEPRERRAADTILGGEDVDRLPGEVVLDEVVSVRWRPFVGHVFNLQTTSGLYIASGVFVANCRCTMALTFKVSE